MSKRVYGGGEESQGGSSRVATILMTGSNGQLGSALRRRWSQPKYLSQFCVVASHHESLDVSDGKLVDETLEQICPDIVVNCAGYNDPCHAQRDRDECWKANVMGPSHLAKGCAERDILMVHISCDSVFGADNTKQAMAEDAARLAGLGFSVGDVDCCYDESCPCGPVDYCGATKLSGEHAILHAAHTHPEFQYWILRSASLFEHPWRTGTSYFWHLAELIKNHTSASSQPIPVVADVLMNLCYAPELAAAVSWMIENRQGEICKSGIYHMANGGTTTWYQVAQQLAMSMGAGNSFGAGINSVVPVSLAEYRSRYTGTMPPMSELGRYRALSTERYRSLGGPGFSNWREVVDSWCLAAGGSSMAVA